MSVMLAAAALALAFIPDNATGVSLPVIKVWSMHFGLEILRIGVLLINIKVRAIDTTKYKLYYWAVFAFAMLITFLVSRGVHAEYPIPGDNEGQAWSLHALNLGLFAGEFAMSFVIGGQLLSLIEANEKLLESEKNFQNEVESKGNAIEAKKKAQAQRDAFKKELGELRGIRDKCEADTARLELLENSLTGNLKRNQEGISVNKKRSRFCGNCGTITVASNNKHKPNCFTCNSPIDWDKIK